jgi:hypothetical protein
MTKPLRISTTMYGSFPPVMLVLLIPCVSLTGHPFPIMVSMTICLTPPCSWPSKQSGTVTDSFLDDETPTDCFTVYCFTRHLYLRTPYLTFGSHGYLVLLLTRLLTMALLLIITSLIASVSLIQHMVHREALVLSSITITSVTFTLHHLMI